ncbi:MAG: diacylglycerol/lipid kinase family protein, partial [bacterium]
GVYNAIIVANAQYFGGGMWIAPNAKLDDGFLEFVLVGDISKPEVIANLRRIYNGTLSEHPKVTTLRGKKLEAWTDETVLLETDGELPGTLPATFEILPGVLRLFVE